MKKYNYIYIIYGLLFFTLHAKCLAAAEWPKIKESDVKIHFVSEKKEALEVTIYDEKGAPAYYLNVKFNAWKYDDHGFNYSGMLDCRMVSADSKTMAYPNLFQNDKMATADWQSDARFTYEELSSLIDTNHGRSIVQKCKFRGMSITLNISNAITATNSSQTNADRTINELDFEIQFVKDPTAHGAYSFDENEGSGVTHQP